MKILFVLEYYYPNIGGVETLFKNLIENLSKNGNEIYIITMQFDQSLSLEENSNSIHIIRIPTQSRYLFTLIAIKKVFHWSSRVDLIHTTSYNAAIPAFIGSIFSRKKVIITFHEVWGKLWFKLPFISKTSALLHFLFEQVLLKIPFHHFIAVSNFTQNKLLETGISPHKISRIYNGIDYSNHPSLERLHSNNFHFVYFGRPGISKGLDILIQGIIPFLKENSDCYLSLVIPKNNDPVVKWISTQINNAGLSEKIQLTGHLPQKELKELLKSAYAVIIPSYSEGFCFAAVESAAYGIPIIAAPNGALPEVVCGSHIFMETFTPLGLENALRKAKNHAWSNIPLLKFQLNETIERYTELYRSLAKC